MFVNILVKKQSSIAIGKIFYFEYVTYTPAQFAKPCIEAKLKEPVR